MVNYSIDMTIWFPLTRAVDMDDLNEVQTLMNSTW